MFVLLYDPFAHFKKAKLDNGLEIFSQQWNCNWQILEVIVHSGAVHDPVGKEGVAHLLEHLISKSVPQKRQDDVIDFFESSGGEISMGQISHHLSSYSFTVPLPQFFQAALLFSQMIMTPDITCEYIMQEKLVIEQEYYLKYSRFNRHLNETMAADLFYGTDYQRTCSIVGNPETLKNIEHSDVLDYYYKHYNPKNITIISLGALAEDELIATLEKTCFALGRSGKRSSFTGENVNLFPPLANRREFSLSNFNKQKDKNSDIFSLTSIAKLPNSNYQVAIALLKNYLSEIFFREIRNIRGWDYAPSIRTVNGKEVVEFQIIFPCLRYNAISEIENVIEECLYMATREVDLFEKEKKRKISSLNLIDLSGSDVVSNASHGISYYGRIITTEEREKEYKRVDFFDILNLFKWLLPKNRWTAIVKP